MIDRIDGLGSVRTAQPVKRVAKSGAASGASFAKELGETEETTASAPLSETSSVSVILGVQEVDDALAHASRGKMRAESILDKLEELRLEILAGDVSKEKLLQLTRMVNSRRAQIKDPRLAELLDAIDLRAQVELAKYAS